MRYFAIMVFPCEIMQLTYDLCDNNNTTYVDRSLILRIQHDNKSDMF